MLAQYGHIFLFILFGFGFSVVNLMLISLVRFKSRDARQKIAYECGMEPVGSPYVRIDLRFYLFALLFVVFEVESLFLYPWAVVAKSTGWLALVEIVIFFFILFMGFLYAHKKGALKWV